MNKESLKKAREIIIKTLDKTDIIAQDRIELMYNIYCLLDETKYEENIKLLKKEMK